MKFMFGLQHPLTCKPSTTLSNPCNKVREVNVVKEIFLRLLSCVLYYCVCYHCVGMYPVYICIFLHESEDDYTTIYLYWIYKEFHIILWECSMYAYYYIYFSVCILKTHIQSEYVGNINGRKLNQSNYRLISTRFLFPVSSDD